MLSHININCLHTLPQSATQNCNQQCQAKATNQDADSVFLNNAHIILPNKQNQKRYIIPSRHRQFSEQITYWKKKRRQNSKYYIQIRTHVTKKSKNKNAADFNKQNFNARHLKTQISNNESFLNMESISITNECQNNSNNTNLNSIPGNFFPGPKKQTDRNILSIQCPIQQLKQYANVLKIRQKNLGIVQKKIQKISTSRALELFSKIIKKQNIQRLRMRKQIVSNTSDVHIRQVVFQDKKTQRPKIMVGLARKPEINQARSVLNCHRKKERNIPQNETSKLSDSKSMIAHQKNEKSREKKRYRNKYTKSMIMDDQDNFQLAGW